MDPFGMAASLYGGTQPFAGGMGQMDPFFGVQMPQAPPQQDPFQFDPRQSWQNPMMMAGAALLGSGGRDFGGALGAFGQGLDRERAKQLQEYGIAGKQAQDQYRTERQGAMDEVAGRRWGHLQEKEQGRYDTGRQESQRKEDEATMARREKVRAYGEELGVERGDLESIDAYEVRLQEADKDRERQQGREDKQWEWKNKPDGRKVATPTNTHVDRLQSDSFQPLPEKPSESATPQEVSRYSREVDATKRQAEAAGMVPKVQNGKIIGYERKWQDVYDDLEKGMAVSQKRSAGEPVLADDLPASDKSTIKQMAASGMGNDELMAILTRQGMPESEAVKAIMDARRGGEGIVIQVPKEAPAVPPLTAPAPQDETSVLQKNMQTYGIDTSTAPLPSEAMALAAQASGGDPQKQKQILAQMQQVMANDPANGLNTIIASFQGPPGIEGAMVAQR